MDEDVKDYRADTGRLAAEAGITLTDEALDGIASLREEGAAGHARLKERLRAKDLTPADYLEACAVARRDLVTRMGAVVPVDGLVRMLGGEARPLDPPPRREGWPYWLRRTLPREREGRDYGGVELIGMLQFLCSAGAFDELDRGYRLVEPAEVDGVALLALLRGPFMWRGRISEWAPLRERTRAHLEAEGKPADKILMGLGRPGDEPRPGPFA